MKALLLVPMRNRRLGAALLLALFIIVVLGSLGVLWVSGLRTVRRVESASHGQRRAAALETLALEETVGALRESARLRAVEPGPPYLPRTPEDTRPPRLLPDGIPTDDPGLSRLRQASQGTIPLSGGKRPLPVPDLGAPRLHAGLGLSADQVFWVYLGRNGPLTEAQARATPSEIVGRYAFTLWDIGGTLDLNHVAHPEIPGASPAVEEQLTLWLARRGGMRSLDAAALLGADEGLESLAAWREPTADPVNDVFGGVATSSTSSLEAYRRFTEQFLPATGGGETMAGTQRFLSRKDFLNVAEALAPGLLEAVGTEYGVFSRGLAEPSARPNRQEAPSASLASSSVADPRSLTTGEVLPTGSPALARRFPLERLALLGYAFPETPSEDHERLREIRRFFGLWRATSADAWTYVGSRADGSFATSVELASLEQIAAETPAREPNLFETLKAAILPLSLGQHLPGAAARDAAELQKNTDFHLLQIGLNLIDQWDADSFPTVLEASPPGWTGEPIRLAGIENLPYISQLHLDALNPFWWEQPVPYEDRRLLPYLIPELWSPHQAALAVPPTSPRWNSTSDPAAGPRAIRLRLEGTVRLSMLEKSSTLVAPRYDVNSGVIVISSEEFASFGPVPRPILNADAKDGCWENSGFTYKGGPVAEQSDDGRLPNAQFYAARLTPLPREKNLLTGAFDARPLNPGYTGGPREPATDYPFISGSAPYAGMATKGVGVNKVYYFTKPDPACLNVELGDFTSNPPARFDVVMDYLDHAGRWVAYTSFGAGSPNHADTHGLGNEDRAVEAKLFSGRLLSHAQHTPEERRRYLDAGGAVTLFKADPRTARLGVALADVTNGYLNGMGGLPPRSPMRWASVLDLEAADEDDTLEVAEFLSLPNRHEKGLGGYFGRGFVNQHRDLQINAQKPLITFAKFTAGDPLYRSPGFGGGLVYPFYFPGLFGENLNFGSVKESHYRDPDGRVRPGDGWLWRHALDRAHSVDPGAAGDEKWLLERSANQLYSNQETFPRVLNRPFQSVAELGHVFRDLPQRSLDLTSPESPDAALLDAFCLRETPVNARGRSLTHGVVNPGGLGMASIAGSLEGVAQAEPQVAYAFRESPYLDQRESNLRDDRSPRLPEAAQESIAANLPLIQLGRESAEALSAPILALQLHPAESAVDLVAALADEDGNPATPPNATLRPLLGPVKADAFGVRTMSAVDAFPTLGPGADTPFPAVKAEREAPLRALADIAEFRVWNLFLDLIVESGQVPALTSPAESLEAFAPKARRRGWYHLAIDRVSGQVLEVQRERGEF